jgi:hypothetical protein
MERELQELHSIEKASIIGGGNGVYVLSDGVVISNSYGSTIYYENGNCLYLDGVQISTSLVAPDTGYQWNGVIHISQPEGWSVNLLLHEYGHYIQQQEMGRWDYFWGVAAPSVWSLLTNPDNHNSKWFEIDATKKGKEYESNYSGNCNDDDIVTGNDPYYGEEWYIDNWGTSGYYEWGTSGYYDDLEDFLDNSGYLDGGSNDYDSDYHDYYA